MNPQAPAFPINPNVDQNHPDFPDKYRGLTIREYIAVSAFSGLIAQGHAPESAAFSAYKYADALIAESNKK